MLPKVLLVNDGLADLDDYERIAHDVGFRDFRRAHTLADAKLLIDAERIDVAIVDLNLDRNRPKSVEGLEVIRLLRETHRACLIMAYTAHFAKQGVEYGIQAIRAGATDFICEEWFDINHETLLTMKLKIWYGHLTGEVREAALV